MTPPTFDTLREAFAAYPAATLAIVDTGNGWGRAKFRGTCPMTGTPVLPGGNAQTLRMVTRDGKERRAFTGAFHHIEKARIEIYVNGRPVMLVTWKRCGGDWVAEANKALQAAPPFSVVEVFFPDAPHGEGEAKRYPQSKRIRGSKWATMWRLVPGRPGETGIVQGWWRAAANG